MRTNTLLLLLSIAWLSACQTDRPGQKPEPPVQKPRPASLELNLCSSTAGTLPANNGLKVDRKSALACTQDIQYLIVPAQDACLLSGFGPRAGRPHKGIDYQGQGRSAVPVIAAADGTVVINKWRSDLGHWIVLDHGKDMYTGYGHLQNASDKLVGMTVAREEPLGTMGATGSAARGLHLHVEFRKGDLKQPEHGGYFKLSPFDPYHYPENC